MLVGAPNVETMTGRGTELSDMTRKSKVNVLCVQETRWKGSKDRKQGSSYTILVWIGREMELMLSLKEEYAVNVLEVKSVRVMNVKLEIQGVMMNVVSSYVPQVGCKMQEETRFWSELDEVEENIPREEGGVIGAHFSGHVGEGNRCDEEVMGKFDVKERNLGGQMVEDFAKTMEMAVVFFYFQKKKERDK